MSKIKTFVDQDGIKRVEKPFPCFHYGVPIRCIVDIINDAKPGDLYSAEYLAAFWAVDMADFRSYILFDDVWTNLHALLENGADEFDFNDAFAIAQKMIHECGRMAEGDIAAYSNCAVQSALLELGY